MKYALISDIHGNLAALDRVLQFLDSCEYDKLVCLGDIVGYGPDPNACCERIREKADIVLLGNHDQAAIGRMDISYFNRYARQAIAWTGLRLQSECRSFLADGLVQAEIDDALCVHASPFEPENWHYVMSRIDALQAFQAFSQHTCFVGHSHAPMIAVEANDTIVLQAGESLDLHPDNRYIINVGSVGQPRDTNPKACVGFYDSSDQTYKLIRLKYDIAETQEKMREQKLPQFLIERLAVGR
ncbi:MAG: metallophosphoesterase family protein [candidate division KSB1 bacterium]|nr:metallophosphoesterase family protein [candidate division KSB1 bacterium]